jgi:hypothetical protein
MNEETDSKRRFAWFKALRLGLGLALITASLTLLAFGLTTRAGAVRSESAPEIFTTSAVQERVALALGGAVPVQTQYLPLVACCNPSAQLTPPATTIVTVPLSAPPLIMTGKGATLAEAQARPEFVLDSESLYAGVHHPDGTYPFYSVARTYLEFDPAELAAVPRERVVHVDLVLYPNANGDACAQVDALLHPGTWDQLDASAWAEFRPALAHFWGQEALLTPYTVPLTGFEDLDDLSRLVLTVDEGATPPPDCVLNTLKVGFFVEDPGDGTPTHLAIQVEEP